jgi:hypothetical protein
MILTAEQRADLAELAAMPDEKLLENARARGIDVEALVARQRRIIARALAEEGTKEGETWETYPA